MTCSPVVRGETRHTPAPDFKLDSAPVGRQLAGEGAEEQPLDRDRLGTEQHVGLAVAELRVRDAQRGAGPELLQAHAWWEKTS